jgi:hypothetical protein
MIKTNLIILTEKDLNNSVAIQFKDAKLNHFNISKEDSENSVVVAYSPTINDFEPNYRFLHNDYIGNINNLVKMNFDCLQVINVNDHLDYLTQNLNYSSNNAEYLQMRMINIDIRNLLIETIRYHECALKNINDTQKLSDIVSNIYRLMFDVNTIFDGDSLSVIEEIHNMYLHTPNSSPVVINIDYPNQFSFKSKYIEFKTNKYGNGIMFLYIDSVVREIIGGCLNVIIK